MASCCSSSETPLPCFAVAGILASERPHADAELQDRVDRSAKRSADRYHPTNRQGRLAAALFRGGLVADQLDNDQPAHEMANEIDLQVLCPPVVRQQGGPGKHLRDEGVELFGGSVAVLAPVVPESKNRDDTLRALGEIVAQCLDQVTVHDAKRAAYPHLRRLRHFVAEIVGMEGEALKLLVEHGG